MALINVTEENFKEETSTGLVLVDFYADWCGPCKMLAPILEELANEDHDVKIVKVNVAEARTLAIDFKVSSIPNITLLKNGEIIHQETGFKPKEMLLQLIESHKS